MTIYFIFGAQLTIIQALTHIPHYVGERQSNIRVYSLGYISTFQMIMGTPKFDNAKTLVTVRFTNQDNKNFAFHQLVVCLHTSFP